MLRKKMIQTTSVWVASVAAFSLLFHSLALTMEPAESISNDNNDTSSSSQNQEFLQHEFDQRHARSTRATNNNNNTSSSSKSQELLARGLAQLHTRIIKATNAKEDVAFKIRLELKKQLESLHDKGLQAKLLSEIMQWWTELPPPQNLVRKQIKNDERCIDEVLDLCFSPALARDHPKFSAINRLLIKIKSFKPKSDPVLNSNVSSRDKEALGNIDHQLINLERYYNDFIKNFCAADPTARKDMLALGIRMSGERLGHYLIPKENALKLLSRTTYDRSAREENPQQGGQSAVVPLGGVHFKAGNSALSDINPAMEWAMHAFATLLRGESIEAITAPSAFLSLQKLDDRVFDDERFAEEAKKAKLAFHTACIFPEASQRITPAQFFLKNPTYESYLKNVVKDGVVQASLTSGDEDLVQILRGNNNNNNIDPVSFGALVIQSLVVVFTDAKDDNIRGTNGKNRLISIDNDRALGDMIFVKDNKHYIQGKNVLYLLPLMDTPVDKTIRNRIKEINATDLIKNWLDLLRQQNECYNELFKNGCLDQETYTKYFPLCVTTGISCVMLKRLQSIQNMLEQSHSITYQQLLLKLFPLAGEYYAKLRSYFPNDPHRAQHAVLYDQNKQEKIKGFEDNSIEAVIKEKLNNDNTLSGQLSVEKSKAGDYQEKRSQSIEEESKFFSDQETDAYRMKIKNSWLQYTFGIQNYYGWGISQSYQKAYQAFNDVIEIEPNHIDALYYLGIMNYFGQGISGDNFKKAYQFFNQVIKIEPNHIDAFYYLGVMNYFGRGTSQDYQKAHFFFNQVIKIKPADIPKPLAIPKKYLDSEGYKLFKKFIDVDPKRANAQYYLGEMNYLGQGRSRSYSNAYKSFDEAIKIEPKHSDALYRLGIMNYLGLGRPKGYPEAYKHFSDLTIPTTTIDQNHVKALYALSEMNYFGRGIPQDYSEAYKLFNQVIAINPEHAAALYFLGEMNYMGWGGIPQNHETARKLFNQVIAIDPKHEKALDYLNKLKRMSRR